MASTYQEAAKEALRRRIDDWMDTSGSLDAVADFDRLPADPADTSRFRPSNDSGDRLHPGDAGNQAMGDPIDIDTIFGDTS